VVNTSLAFSPLQLINAISILIVNTHLIEHITDYPCFLWFPSIQNQDKCTVWYQPKGLYINFIMTFNEIWREPFNIDVIVPVPF